MTTEKEKIDELLQDKTNELISIDVITGDFRYFISNSDLSVLDISDINELSLRLDNAHKLFSLLYHKAIEIENKMDKQKVKT